MTSPYALSTETVNGVAVITIDLPGEPVNKLNRALSAAMDDPIVVKRFADLGYDVVPSQQRSPAAFEDFMRKEVDLWAKVLGTLKPASPQ